ncbi:MAG: hypothetical protein QXG03_10360 [Halalkalicoccus sp.]
MERRVADARTTLSIVPGVDPIENARQAVEGIESPEEWNVLLVAYGTDHDRLCREWHERLGISPKGFGTICVAGDADRKRRAEPVSATGRDVTVTVSGPTNVTELGTTTSLYLDDWTDGRTLVCFHSLETLVAHAETETVFRFLHVLTNRIADTGSVGRFSIDSTTTDERTIRTLTPLFDTVSETVPDEREEPESVPADTAFDVLRAPRRRYVLYSLREATGPTTISALASKVAYHELNTETDRIETSLHHSHLPKLENAGLISIDGSNVTKRPSMASLDPYLDLVSEEDLSD